MKILGISAGFSHDASACILIDGKIKYAIEEERITRKKHAEHQKPINAIKHCLDYCNITLNDIDVVAISWDPYKFSDFCLTPSDEMFYNALFPYSLHGHFKKPPIHIVPHHIAHAAHVFWNSSYDESCVVVMDGTGEKDSGSIFMGSKKNGLQYKYSFGVGESLGYFYQAASSYCGLGFMGVGKLMGLAAYGEKNEFIFDNFHLDSQRGYYIDNPNISFEDNMKYWYKIFSEQQIPSNIFLKKEVFSTEYIDFASKVQNTLNNVMINVINSAIKETNCYNVCFSGGVSMNSATNLCITEKSLAKSMFTFAGGGDAGTSIGAAMQTYFEFKKVPCVPLETAYLGNELNNDDIYTYLKKYNLKFKEYDENELIDISASYLLAGLSMGVVKGREEFGSRALGNRSIFLDPKTNDGRIKLNTVKKREYWRPFAPVILEECFTEYLHNPYPSKYMTTNFNVTKKGQEIMKEAIHIDNTCRPQMAVRNSFIDSLLRKIYKFSNSGALLNTSFNTKGNPIVHSTDDALREYFSSSLDILILGNFVLTK